MAGCAFGVRLEILLCGGIRLRRGISMVELLIAAAVLCLLAIPLAQLNSTQGRQLASAAGESELNARAQQSLAAAEAELARSAFRQEIHREAGGETLHAVPSRSCRGLWQITVQMHALTLTKLVVNREEGSADALGEEE